MQAAEGTSRKEGGTWEVGEVADRRGSGLRLERKGNPLVRSARRGVGAEGSVTCLLERREGKQR